MRIAGCYPAILNMTCRHQGRGTTEAKTGPLRQILPRSWPEVGEKTGLFVQIENCWVLPKASGSCEFGLPDAPGRASLSPASPRGGWSGRPRWEPGQLCRPMGIRNSSQKILQFDQPPDHQYSPPFPHFFIISSQVCGILGPDNHPGRRRLPKSGRKRPDGHRRGRDGRE